MMYPGMKNDVVSALHTQTSVSGYEKLCNTDVLSFRRKPLQS